MHTGQYMFFIWLFSLHVALSESETRGDGSREHDVQVDASGDPPQNSTGLSNSGFAIARFGGWGKNSQRASAHIERGEGKKPRPGSGFMSTK